LALTSGALYIELIRIQVKILLLLVKKRKDTQESGRKIHYGTAFGVDTVKEMSQFLIKHDLKMR